MSQPGKRILLVDDHDAIQRYYGPMLQGCGYEVTTAYTGEQAVQLATTEHFDLVIMDISMPKAKMDGITACQEIHTRVHTPVLILTVAREAPGQDWQPLAQAAQAKAVGFIDKQVPDDVFLRAVQRALKGERLFDPEEEKAALIQQDQRCRKIELYESLSRREKQILELIRQGRSNRAIADELCLSVLTVDQHVGSILGKLKVANRSQAAVFAATVGREDLT